MTEMEYRKAFVSSASFWLGTQQGSDKHKQIIDIYNSITPLPRGYKVQYHDAWCATFVSAVAKNFEMGSAFPYECSCYYMVMKLIASGQWVEADDYVPSIGDLIFYDWKDSENFANTDNINVPSHVGIIESVEDYRFSVIEGNYSNSVKRRSVTKNGRYIRGFGHLDMVKCIERMDTEWAKEVGLFIGDGKGNFRWGDNVTREELATVLRRYYNLRW